MSQWEVFGSQTNQPKVDSVTLKLKVFFNLSEALKISTVK